MSKPLTLAAFLADLPDPLRTYLAARLVETPDHHWLWTGVLNNHGYGRMRIGNGNYQLVHRFVYQQIHGPLAPGVEVMHVCDLPACCSDAHLTDGTHKDNMQDCVRKGRIASGERHGMARLSARDVLAIRNAANNGVRSPALAEQYHVSARHIRKIVQGCTWKAGAA